MYLAVMVGKFVKQVVRELCSSTTGPLLPTMTDSLLAPGREVLYKHIQAVPTLLPVPRTRGGPSPGISNLTTFLAVLADFLPLWQPPPHSCPQPSPKGTDRQANSI